MGPAPLKIQFTNGIRSVAVCCGIKSQVDNWPAEIYFFGGIKRKKTVLFDQKMIIGRREINMAGIFGPTKQHLPTGNIFLATTREDGTSKVVLY